MCNAEKRDIVVKGEKMRRIDITLDKNRVLSSAVREQLSESHQNQEMSVAELSKIAVESMFLAAKEATEAVVIKEG